MNNSFNLLFTAISRAKKRCIMVGYESLFYGAACNKNKGNDKKAPLTTIIDEIKKYFRN
jgi:ATP-dependent exoDNAse (exonuclease V) alpha subunit